MAGQETSNKKYYLTKQYTPNAHKNFQNEDIL